VSRHRPSIAVGTGSDGGRPRTGAQDSRAAHLRRQRQSDPHSGLRRPPRQDRARATFDAVLEAAADVITRRGYAAMTTNAVARRAGVSIGSVYQYFPNKTAILVCLLERHIRQIQPIVASGLATLTDSSQPFEEALRETLLGLVAAHDHHGPRLQQVLSEEVPHPPSIQRLRQKLEGGYVAEVADAFRRRRDVHAEHPEIAAQLFVVVAEAMTVWLSHSAPASIDKRVYVDEVVRMLGGYLKRGA
jgi:AcrR family transcriptional regulator